MTEKQLDVLYEKGLLPEADYQKLRAIAQRKIFSVYGELRTLLYLGVLLFSTGAGIFIYNNIGQIGHYLSLFVLLAATVGCFWFVTKKQLPFSKSRTESANPYFDYSLLLGCLLVVIDLGYLQFLFGWFTNYVSWLSLFTAVVFFYFAYRQDHLGVLSLGITALASFWGLAISPANFYAFNFFEQPQLHWVAVFFGAGIFAAALLLERFGIKAHFTKTYLNFGVLIGFFGSTSMLFNGSDENYAVAIGQVLAAAILGFYSYKKETVLYMIYAYIFGFIAFTYILVVATKSENLTFWMLYLMAVSFGFVKSIMTVRKRFKHDS